MNFKVEYLTTNYQSISSKEFYRDIFTEGSLQEKGRFEKGKYNAIAVELFLDSNKRNKRYTITDDLEIIDELLTHPNFIVMSPISYIGKARTSNNARFLYALAIDLDGVSKKQYMVDLFYQMDGNGPSNHLPKPTYIVDSGNGLHIYYVFEKPIPCFKNINSKMNVLKNSLTFKIWNGYTTSLSENIQYQSIFQGFRMVGSPTKSGGVTTAYKIGEKVTVDYLNKFIPWKEKRAENFEYKSKLTLEEVKKKYPDWYQKKIINKEPKKTGEGKCWNIKRNLYDWWKRRLEFEIKEGHRYFGIMCLAIYARKCGLTKKELENDAFLLMPQLDKLTSEESNHFTRKDVLAALEAFDDKYITFSIDNISKLTNIHIQKNKRNYRSQKDHLEEARMIRDLRMKRKGMKWDDNNKKQSKEKLVIDYLKENPTVTNKAKIAKELGVSRPTVYKYLNKMLKAQKKL